MTTTTDPYSPETMKLAGWKCTRITPPIGLSGAMYHADGDDDEAIVIWWRPHPDSAHRADI